MPINEVFERPLIKTVAFQVTFPQLFSIEAKIGDFQSAIMKQFPESILLMKQHFMLVQRLEGAKEATPEPSQTQQVWQFKSPGGVTVDVSRGSLSIVSQSHKTYAQPGSSERFREVIDLICGNFFKIVRIPVIHRIGLRYINECPLSQKTNEHYSKYYNGALPIHRFPLENADDMEATVVAERGAAKIRYFEKLEATTPGFRITLDMDAWSERIDSADILTTADVLRDVISAQFEAFATNDLLAYMRNETGDSP